MRFAGSYYLNNPNDLNFPNNSKIIMNVKAEIKNIHISPRKTRLVIDVVRGLDIIEAMQRLALINKRAVRPVEKLLKSVLANAENNFELNRNNLYIKEIIVGAGPTLYRWMPKAHGSSTPLRRRTSQIKVVLGERVETALKKTTKSKKIETVKVTEKLPDKVEEKVELNKKAAKTDREEVAVEKVDGRRHASRVDQVQPAGKSIKKEKGIFKKMFRRKSGM